jgi:hypothetical protein
MKKIFFFLIICLGCTIKSNAQEITKNAIGLRLGDSRGFGAEISYQRAILKNNRIELDFGWRNGKNYNGVKLVGLFHWIWNIDGGFNWYAGPGAGFGTYRFDNQGGKYYRDSFLFLSGAVGIEYKFDIPLLLSLDIRPELGFGDDVYDNNDLDFDVAFSVRYTF